MRTGDEPERPPSVGEVWFTEWQIEEDGHDVALGDEIAWAFDTVHQRRVDRGRSSLTLLVKRMPGPDGCMDPHCRPVSAAHARVMEFSRRFQPWSARTCFIGSATREGPPSVAGEVEERCCDVVVANRPGSLVTVPTATSTATSVRCGSRHRTER